MDGMIEIFRGQDESDITIKAGGKWKYHGEKGTGGGGGSSGNENNKCMSSSLVFLGDTQQKQ